MNEPIGDPVRLVLPEIARRIPPERVDRAWLFPTRRLSDRWSGLVALALFPDAAAEDPDRRELVSVRFQVHQGTRGRPRLEATFISEGVAPSTRLDRVIAGVLARLGEEAESPEVRLVGGDPARWAELAGDDADPDVDPSYQ